METAARVLAVLGIIAVVIRLVRAALWMLRGGVDAFLARDLADARAQRGDLTGIEDAEAQRGLARRTRMLAAGQVFVWAGLLVVPLLTPWPVMLYASWSLLWLLPHRPLFHR